MACLLHQQYPRSPDHVSISERSICELLETGSLTAWDLRLTMQNGIDDDDGELVDWYVDMIFAPFPTFWVDLAQNR